MVPFHRLILEASNLKAVNELPANTDGIDVESHHNQQTRNCRLHAMAKRALSYPKFLPLVMVSDPPPSPPLKGHSAKD